VDRVPHRLPRCREVEREVAVLRVQPRQALERIRALEAEVRCGRRWATPFWRDNPSADRLVGCT
jgi:hypothetical protein